MNKKNHLIFLIGIFCFVLIYGLSWADIRIGSEAPNFTLPSTQDRIIDYYKEYYGKYHLIITFFPAAFTPV